MKLMAIDGNSIINRAFYGVRLLSTRDGLYTNAVFGFLNILTKLLDDQRPDALCVAFDVSAPTFRHEMYEGYKASRKKMPEELAMQMPVMKEVLGAMNVPVFELAGWEADDVIGTISAKCAAAGWECVLATGDKDSFQLISDFTSVNHVKSRMGQTETVLYTPARFFEEYGFEPPKMVDLKALMGDSSDEIPGVPGVGEKTALDLIRRFGTVEQIYADLSALGLRDSLVKKLEAGRDMAKLSYTLAKIDTAAPIDFTPDACLRVPPDNDRLWELFKRLEFNRMTERFGLTPPAAAPKETEEVVFTTVRTESELKAVLSAEAAAIVPDVTLDRMAVATAAGIYVIGADSFEGDWSAALAAVFSSAAAKYGHNVKDVIRALMGRGITYGKWDFDTALAAYLIEPTDNSYSLEVLSERYLGESLRNAEPDGQISLLSGGGVSDLAAEVRAVWRLRGVLEPKLTETGLDRVMRDIELPLCPVLAGMEREGFLVDTGALTSFGALLRERESGIEEQIYELAGEEFNINSPKQLGTVLFEKLMLPAPKRTKTGYSTNVEVLQRLKWKHPIIALILEYRELEKLRSTYADGLLRFIGEDSRIRTTFQMTVTATGRLSSTDPNLQNIPIRKGLGGELRKMFVAAPGNVLVDADYSQIELRLLANISGDENMCAAFLSGEDFHKLTASQVFGVSPEDVTPQMRSSAKAVNFGIIYGISAFSLAQDIGVPVAEAKQYMETYLARFSGVREYMRNVVEKAKEDGYVTTVFGRRRNLPELKSSNFNIRSFGERVALNMPIQGTAADIMKIAMIRAGRMLKEAAPRARLILQVHDELVAECPEEDAELVKETLRAAMEGAASFKVPLTAEAGVGRNWYEAK